MISKELQHVREFEKSESAFIAKEDRPVFHLSPRIGWLNDPNGFSFYNGEYHLFYQYHPYSSYWGPMHWGHAVSKDLINWEYLPAAMAPDTDYDGAGCFSGTAITLPDGRQLLMYTGCGDSSRDPLGKGRWLQTQCVAVSEEQDDGSIEYSAVTHPLPVSFRNGGTLSSTLAVQSTQVLPHLTRTLPAAYFVKLRTNSIGRS